ncbi:hypothetical protein [Pseudoalteromonas marina]|uniref:Uncharacterized protein n=1 Tax=Pseudoalteromonas marina TaxID=267375 RepID=A0ABT9FG73_9GAMM|nr:hypothetical protein [Pseudoalteromonas marina]MDP2565779.1 hypothetical protein [Pseudoalteromonas marina]
MINQSAVDTFMNKPLSKTFVELLKKYLTAKSDLDAKTIIAEKCQKEALDEVKPVYAPLVFKRRGSNETVSKTDEKTGKPIQNFNELYLASDKQAEQVFSIHSRKMAENGLANIGEFDQQLMAKSDLRKIELEISEAFKPITGISAKSIFNLELRNKLINLLMKILLGTAKAQNLKLD